MAIFLHVIFYTWIYLIVFLSTSSFHMPSGKPNLEFWRHRENAKISKPRIHIQIYQETLYIISKDINFGEVICDNRSVEFECVGIQLSFIKKRRLSEDGGISGNI